MAAVSSLGQESSDHQRTKKSLEKFPLKEFFPFQIVNFPAPDQWVPDFLQRGCFARSDMRAIKAVQNTHKAQPPGRKWDNDGRPASHSHLSTSRIPSHGSLSSQPLALSQLIPQMLPFSLGVPPCHNLGQVPFISSEAIKIDRKEILLGEGYF